MSNKARFTLAILYLSSIRPILSVRGSACSQPRIAKHSRIVNVLKPLEVEEPFPLGSVLSFECDPGYTSFGSRNLTCSEAGWIPEPIECFVEVAQTNRFIIITKSDPQYDAALTAVDGDPTTCVALKKGESRHLLSVDTFQAHRVRVVSIMSRRLLLNSTIEIRVGSYFPSTGVTFNQLCIRKHVTDAQQGHSTFYCEHDVAEGRYISISIIRHREDEDASLCEVEAYSDSSLSVQDVCAKQAHVQYVFQNQCVNFLGEYSNSEARQVCAKHRGTLVMPTSRALQNFLDFYLLRIVQANSTMFSNSYWIDAIHSPNQSRWISRNGGAIRDGYIEKGFPRNCVVSEDQRWHVKQCDVRNQVICISPPYSCGTPAVPEFATAWNGGKVLANNSINFTCSTDRDQKQITLYCHPNGTFLGNVNCVRASDYLTPNPLDQMPSWFRSVEWFADSSASYVKLIVLLTMLPILLSAAFLAWLSMLKRRRDAKNSKESSLRSFTVHTKDLPVANLGRFLKTPICSKSRSILSMSKS